MNINFEKLVSNHDLNKFIQSQNLKHKCMFFEDEFESIDELFPGDNNFAVVFLYNEGTEVGHWVLLLNLSTSDKKHIEYFDCLGKKPIPRIEIIRKRDNYDITFLNKALMAPDGILCGKYVISRIMSRDTKLDIYFKILTSNKSFTPDAIIDNMYRLEY